MPFAFWSPVREEHNSALGFLHCQKHYPWEKISFVQVLKGSSFVTHQILLLWWELLKYHHREPPTLPWGIKPNRNSSPEPCGDGIINYLELKCLKGNDGKLKITDCKLFSMDTDSYQVCALLKITFILFSI